MRNICIMTSGRHRKVEPSPAVRVAGGRLHVDERAAVTNDRDTFVSTDDFQLHVPLRGPEKSLQSPRFRSSTPGKTLQFVNLTKDPEIERKSNANRFLVRSTAINHALKERGSNAIQANSRRKRQHPKSGVNTRDAKVAANTGRSDTLASAAILNDIIPIPQSLDGSLPDPFSSFAVDPSASDLHVAAFCKQRTEDPIQDN